MHTMHCFCQHDCVVGAIVEHIYSSTFKFSLLKNRRNLSSEMLHFYLHQNAFGGRALPKPVGELTALPQLLYSLVEYL